MTLEAMILDKISILSPGQRKVAEYILKNIDVFSYATLSRLSKEISVSETTIIRLAYSLGFDSFSEMQQRVRDDILGSNIEKKAISSTGQSFYQAVFSKECAALNDWISRVDEAQLDQVVEAILDAEHILVVGARFSNSAARWFGNRLNLLLGHTDTVQEFYDAKFNLLNHFSEKTLVICIAFARYTKWTLNYARAGKKWGASVISFTDRVTSPLCALSDITVLAAPLQDNTGASSPLCLYCLFSALIAKIRDQRDDVIVKRLQDCEKIYQEFDLFDE